MPVDPSQKRHGRLHCSAEHDCIGKAPWMGFSVPGLRSTRLDDVAAMGWRGLLVLRFPIYYRD
jgi:hypothetical protein